MDAMRMMILMGVCVALTTACGEFDEFGSAECSGPPGESTLESDNIMLQVTVSGGFTGESQTRSITTSSFGGDAAKLSALQSKIKDTGIYDCDEGCYSCSTESSDGFQTDLSLFHKGRYYHYRDYGCGPDEIAEVADLIENAR